MNSTKPKDGATERPPWSIFRDYIGHTCGYQPKLGSNQRQLSKEEAAANAALIVRAVNEHAALLAVAEAAEELLKTLEDHRLKYALAKLREVRT